MTLARSLFGRNAGIIHHEGFRLLLVANSVGALGLALLSPLMDSLTTPFGVSAARIGLVVTVFAAPSVVLIPLSGVFTDRFGRKPILVAGLVCFGVGGTAIAFTTDFRVVLGLRALQGIGSAGLIPVIITSLGDLYDGDAEATAQGIRFGVSGASQAVFPLLASLLVAVAWQYPFFIYGLALPVAAAILLWFDEPADAVVDGREPASGSKRQYLASLARLVGRRRSMALLLARGVVVLPFVGFMTYSSLVVVRVHGATPQHAGVLIALYSSVFAIAATQAGRVTAAFQRPTVPLVLANLLLGGGLAGFALAPSVYVAAPIAMVMGVGIGLTLSLYRSAITGLAPQELRGGLVSLSEGGSRIVTTITPVLIGGSLSLLEPGIGQVAALRWTVAATGVLAGLVGIGAILVVHYSPMEPHAPAGDSPDAIRQDP